MKKLKQFVAICLAGIACIFTACAKNEGNISDNSSFNDSSNVESSDDSTVMENVSVGFLDFESLDQFETGSWKNFGETSGENSVLSIYEGRVGLGDVRRDGKFLKFAFGTPEQSDSRVAFSTATEKELILEDLERRKAEGFTSIETEIYTMYNLEIYIVLYGGAITNYQFAMQTFLWPVKWTKVSYSIDALIGWYSSDFIGLEKGKMPLFGFVNDTKKYADVYFSEFVFVK